MNKKNLKSLLQNKQKIISRETGYPSQSSGRDGDFQVRRIPGQGIFLFYKWYNKWYSSRLTQYRPRTAEHKEPVKLPIGVKPIKEGDLSIDNGIVFVGKSGNKSNKIISVDKDNLADITTPAYFKRTDTTDMADDEAKDPTFLIENTGHAHLRFYSPSNVYDQFISFGRRHPETFTTASWCMGLDSSANKFRIMYKGVSGSSSSNHTKISELTPSSGDSYEALSMNSSGNIWLGLVQNPGSDTDKFLVIDDSNNGLVGFRTGAEVLSDIGGQASGNYITGTGSLSVGDLTNIGNLSGTNTGDQLIPTNFLRDNADDSTTGTITAAGFTTTGTWTFDDATSGTVGITTVHTGSSFTDNDTSLMTAGAIKEKIEDYGYTTATYSVMASGNSYAAGLVAAGSGTHSNQFLRKDGTWVVPENDNTTYSAGSLLDLSTTTFNVDLTELTDGTADVVGSEDELVYLDDSVQKRKLISEIKLGQFNNDAGWTTNTGTISWDGSTANGVATYKDADEATVESNLTFDGTDLSITSTGKLILGAGDTSIYESAADVLNLTVGGQNMILLSEGGSAGTIEFNNCSTGVIIGSGTPLYFDGGTSTHISESSADNIRFTVGNDTVLDLTEEDTGTTINMGTSAAGFTRSTYADAANVTIDFRTGNKAHLDMTGGSISGTLTLQFPAVSGNFVLVVQQDGSTRTIANYATKDSAGNAGNNDGGTAGAVRWAGGTAPDLTDGNNKRDILSFYWDATEEVCYGVASLDF